MQALALALARLFGFFVKVNAYISPHCKDPVDRTTTAMTTSYFRSMAGP
jgi:hypothetical protein